MPTDQQSLVYLVQDLADQSRAQGIEPNRVRIGPKLYRQLNNEVNDIQLVTVGFTTPTVAIQGLAVEVWYTCPPDQIYVDCKPEGEKLGELEERLRAQLGYPYAN